MVITLPNQDGVTPAGKPVAVPIPDTPVVLCVTFVIAVLTLRTGELDATPTVLLGIMVIVPVALTELQPPVRGML
jgi:hypothetical protein